MTLILGLGEQRQTFHDKPGLHSQFQSSQGYTEISHLGGGGREVCFKSYQNGFSCLSPVLVAEKF